MQENASVLNCLQPSLLSIRWKKGVLLFFLILFTLCFDFLSFNLKVFFKDFFISKPSCKNCQITVVPAGRFGNQIGQYSTLLTLQELTGVIRHIFN